MNQLVVCGLNHHSSPIMIREKFAIPESCIGHALRGLASLPAIKESVLLSTCNRTEVYAVVSDVKEGLAQLESFFMSVQAIGDHEALKPNFKLLRDDVALHLMRVASGLDSLVIGEGQIMSQVKQAHRTAQESGTIGPVLDHLFNLALKCGKKVRSETALGRRAVSISSAAVELARHIAGNVSERNCTVIGAGKMARICLKYLSSDKGSGKVGVFNRTLTRLNALREDESASSNRIQINDSFEERYQSAATSRVTIVATSAPSFLLEAESFAAARAIAVASGKAPKECLIVDISVPRNVDPKIGELEGVTLKHADDLACIVNKNMQERQALIGEAEEVVFDVLDEFQAWKRSRLVVPTIAGLREKIESIRLEQISKGIRAAASGSTCPHKEDAENLSKAIINQILHHPTVQLKATKDYQVLRQQAEALRTLFNLEPCDTTKSGKRPSPVGG